MNWTGGTLGGTLNIPVGAVMNIVTPSQGCCSPALFSMSAATINNSGTVNHSWTGGGYGLYIYNNSVINNAGTWNVMSDVAVTQGDGTSSFFNNAASGTFNKIGGANTSNWSMPFAGAGAINLQTGTLSLNGTYTRVIAGTIAIGNQAQLNYGQGGTLDGGKVTGTGTMNFDASTVVEGAYSFAGVTDITGGTTVFQGATSIATLNLIGGTMIGAGPVTITGTMNWTGGTLGGGTLNIPVAGVLNIITPSQGCCSPALFSMSGTTINNSGTVNHSWTGSGYGLYVYNHSTINNAGNWNVISDTAVSAGDTSVSVFNNSGTLTKSGGTNTSVWSIAMNNTGTANMETGTLTFAGFYPESVISGTLNIAAPAVLNYAQEGAFNNGQANGAGMLNFTTSSTNGTNYITGTYKFTVPTQVSSGTLNVKLASTLNAGNLTLTSASLQVDGNTSIGNLNVSAAIGNSSDSSVAGAGSITVSDTLNWNQGSVNVTGIFNVQNMTFSPNSSLSVKLGTSAISVTAKLTLNGTLTLTPTGSSPAIGTVFQILNFANNFGGNFLDLSIPVIGTNDYLNESLTATGLSFKVTQDPAS